MWTGEARCKQHTDDGLPAFAWTVEPTDSPRDPKLLGRHAKQWIEMAVIQCGACPCQYDCARFGVIAGEEYNTWAMPIGDLRDLQLRPDWRAIIDVAEDFQEPVSQAVRRALT